MSNIVKFPKPHAYNEGWRAGLRYAADIAEELCICGGQKHSTRTCGNLEMKSRRALWASPIASLANMQAEEARHERRLRGRRHQ
jgi:hypothetical protein